MASSCKLVQNIAGHTSRSNIAKVGLSYSLNMYQETQDDEHSCNLLMRSIDGMNLACSLDGECRGMYRVSRGYDEQEALYVVFGQTLYYVSPSHETFTIGHIDSFGTHCSMVETGGYGSAHPHLVIADGVNVYAFNTGLALGDQAEDFRSVKLPLRVNSDQYSIKPTHLAYLYGYLVVNDAGTDAFYTSYQYPFETYAEDESEYWDIFQVDTEAYKDYGFITYSEWQPDATLALISTGSKLYTFGSRSWQMFSYNSDVNNPFNSPDNAAQSIGLKAADSLAQLGKDVCFLGSADQGEDAVFHIVDNVIERISTKDIERAIANEKNASVARACMWQEHQHTFYAISFDEDTYVYDLNEKAWHNRSSLNDSNVQKRWRYDWATWSYGHVYFGTKNALVYADDSVYVEHDGKPILKLRRGGVLTSNDQPFYIDSLELIVNNGQHELEHDPRMLIRYSWDGSTWSDYEDCYFGKIGHYDYTTTLWHLGLGRFFTLEVSTTEAIPFTLQNMKIEWSATSCSI